MSMLKQTYPPSFKKVAFFVSGMTTTGGIKHAKHVFPNSSNQKIESLGKKQHTHILEGFVTNDEKESNYSEKRDALIAVLDSGTKGDLIHPLFGKIEDIKCVDWNLIEDFAELGKANFSMTFEIDLDQSVPVESESTIIQVLGLSDDLVDSIEGDFSVGWDDIFPANIADMIEKGLDVIEKVEKAVEIFNIVKDKIDSFTDAVSKISEKIVSLVRAPLKLAESISNLVETVSGMYSSVKEAFDVLVELFNFGDDDKEFETDTARRINRDVNNEIMNEFVQTLSLTHCYNLASQIQFDTIRDQQIVADKLEAQYQKIIKRKTYTTLAGDGSGGGIGSAGIKREKGLSNESKDILTSQRVAVQKLFDENRIALGQLVDIETPLTSSRLLAYQYYGESTLGEELALLNNFSDASFVEGEMEIITE